MGKSKSQFTVQHPDRTVWLGSLPQGITAEEIMPVMKTVGDCKRVEVGKGSGFAFFSSPAEAQAAIEQLNGAVIGGASIQVDTWTVSPKTPKPGKTPTPAAAAGNQQKGSTGVWKQQFQKQMGQKGWSSPAFGSVAGVGCGGKGQFNAGGNAGQFNAGPGASAGQFQKMFQQFMTMMQTMQQQPGGGSGKSAKKKGTKDGKQFELKVEHRERTVWLGNLAKGTKAEDLLPMFKTVGDCKRVQVGNKGTGFAFFGNEEGALAAIASLNGAVVNGKEIQVDEWTKPEKKAK